MTLLLADLVTQVLAQMETSGFTQLTIRGYERVFNRLLRLANDRGDSYYTTELGQAFISDDSHIIPENTERYYKERTQNYIRCVRHIESYLRYGIVDWTPALHHASFPIKSLAIKASFDTFLKKMDEQGLKPNTVDGYRRFCYYFIVIAETITGSTAESTTFHVYSNYADSYIVLSSSSDVANVAQHNWAGIYQQNGNKKCHGFYKVTQQGGGVNRSFIWAPSATTNTSNINTCEEVKISFPGSGDFTVTISPLSSSSASIYWKVDYISYWVYDASWMTTIESGCSVYPEADQKVYGNYSVVLL